MQSDYVNNQTSWKRLVIILMFLVYIIIIFIGFSKENNERIILQNQSYVEDAAIQVAARVDDMLASAKNNINIMAYLCETMLTSPELSPQLLNDISEISSFDYLEFVNKDGINITAGGATADVSDREYYIEGMQGNSGTFVTTQSRITNETLVTFYTPLRYKGEIIGVLNGIYQKAGMQEIISSDFFGVQAKSYLCMKDGAVISSCGDDIAPDNVLTALPGSFSIDEKELQNVKHAFENREAYSYRYNGSQGPGNAYMIGLAESDWMLIITFPSKVTNDMIDDANAAGVHLEIMLILAFGLYIIFLILQNYRQRKRLVSEKQEMSRIVAGVTRLFARFIIVDLENDKYEYLENIQEGQPKSGVYSELVDDMSPRYVKVGTEENMSSIITRDYIQTHLTDTTPYLQCEYQVQWENKPQSWENISILSLSRNNGVPTVVLFAIQDITALKNADLQSRIALEAALQAADEASHAKSDFLSRMSHDIRTPMNAIMGMTTVAMMHIEDRERLADCLNKINTSSRHLLALINDVLDMSKIESGKVTLAEEELDLKQLIDSLLAIIQPQIQAKKQRLLVDTSGIEHKEVIGDPLRLQQVFVNILGNAVKFTPEGGTITINISEMPSRIPGRSCYEFVFEDTGIGMSREFIEKIFDPFSRAKQSTNENVEGTGLGMPISRNIVRMMNGDIQVESEPGAGSKFTVVIYLKLQDLKEIPGTTPKNQENNSDISDFLELKYSGKRILLVEDNEINMEIAGELLTAIGLEVEKAYDGQQAVDTLLEKPEHYYDLVFMDIRMPNKTGYEAAKEIRASNREDLKTIPIVAMSADAFSDDIRRAKSSGMNDHVAKPVELPKLLAALKKWIP